MVWKRKYLSAAAIWLLAGLLCFDLSAQSKPVEKARKEISLHSGWEFRQRVEGPASETTAWRPARVPGVVHTDLLNQRLIPDPFYRDNEAKLQWIENADWEYRNTIQGTPEILNHRNIELVFEGLDTIADIYLNEKLVLSADNMFREWRADVKPYLKPGANSVLVVFHSVFLEMKKAPAADPWYPQTQQAERNYIRKAAYEYGWDWGPRFVTSGIWRPVHLELWDAAKISDLHIAQGDVTQDVANLTAMVEVTSSVSGAATVKVEYSEAGKRDEAVREVILHPGVNPIEMPISIAKPDLWYPVGYGPQTIYNFRAQVLVGKGLADQSSVRTGLRSVVLRRERDAWGRSFAFFVNGIPVFAKGADVIPFDSFPSRVTSERYRKILQSARDANMNMIRLWGGGVYESQEFYDLCDELGLMIWHDFMFATAIPDAIRENVTREAEYQVRRLRNHPSIVLWCGNNELEWLHEGPRLSNLKPEGRERMAVEYLALFSGILPRTVAKLSPETPYWPSSPSADYEWTSPSFDSGDTHNWEIWHRNRPPGDYEKSFPRFMSEYGFQSLPDMRTIEAFTLPEDRDIRTPVMLAHQKNGSGNQKIRDYMLRWYAEPRDFASFVYLSQILQAEVIKIGAEHLRRNRPRIMGSLYWQFNDCWPVISWASVDSYGRWKALHYYARRFYNDLLVSPHEENGSVAVYVVSDRTTPTSASLRVRLTKFDGTVLSEKAQPIDLPALSSKAYVNLPREELLGFEGYDPTKVFLSAELMVNNKLASSNALFLALPKDLQLPTPQIAMDLTKAGDAYRLRLSSSALARNVYVSAGNFDASYSDNYFDLLPRQVVEIELKSSASLEELRSALKVVSLTDASHL